MVGTITLPKAKAPGWQPTAAMYKAGNAASVNTKPPKGSTVTSAQLSPGQLLLQRQALPHALAYAKENLAIPKSQELVAPFTAAQLKGQQMALDAAGDQATLAKRAADTSNFMLDPAALTAAGNPMEQAAIDAAVRPITQSLTEDTLPQLRSGAAASGQYGSSRQGIAEGLASGRASQAIGDTGAKIAESAYQSNLDAMTRALGLAPQTGQMQTQAATTTSGVGEVQQGQRQATDEANLSRDFYNKNIPLAKAQNLTQLEGATGGGGTSSSTAEVPWWQKALSGGLGGASLGASIGGAPGAAVGGGMGALLSFLDN